MVKAYKIYKKLVCEVNSKVLLFSLNIMGNGDGNKKWCEEKAEKKKVSYEFL